MAIAPVTAGDMFLLVKGAKNGLIKGESTDQNHKEEIEVLRWTWGMQAKPSLGGGGATGKATVNDLKIVKRIDRASTALMQALRTNEVIKKAVLTIRKAGDHPLEYLKISIDDGRVTALTVEAGDLAGGGQAVENVSFSFNKITVEYTPQNKDGQGLGSLTFEDQWAES